MAGPAGRVSRQFEDLPLVMPLLPTGAWVRSAEGTRDICAALDLGTNNCRLLIARRQGDGFRIIDAFSRIVRLGEGLATTGRLSEAAMERTLGALRVCAGKVARSGACRARYVATEACRRAANCGDFLDRVRRDTGIGIEIISSDEEARLVVTGCAALLDPALPHGIVFDIGGGSTELAWIEIEGAPPRPRVRDYVSVPHGVVTFADRYGGHAVSEATYEAMVEEIHAALVPFARGHDTTALIAANRIQLLGSSGTVTTLASVHLDLPRYDRSRVDGSTLRFGDIERISRRLVALSWEKRAAHPCIGDERADLVLAGCAILEAICRLWPVGCLVVADRGIREGILLGLFQAAA
ncbi:MAG TPA: Ppx/GppA phosphatase family protein [Stellaceae bacterium]|nr:Ppx/GppA phosphatase family protein [Stellaceae bacterium]